MPPLRIGDVGTGAPAAAGSRVPSSVTADSEVRDRAKRGEVLPVSDTFRTISGGSVEGASGLKESGGGGMPLARRSAMRARIFSFFSLTLTTSDATGAGEGADDTETSWLGGADVGNMTRFGATDWRPRLIVRGEGIGEAPSSAARSSLATSLSWSCVGASDFIRGCSVVSSVVVVAVGGTVVLRTKCTPWKHQWQW